jgi:hypothetical protein
MSYVNFSLTHNAADFTQSCDRISAGFSREGGRVEFVERSHVDRGPLPPLTTKVALTDEVKAASQAVLNAIQSSGWVQDVTVDDGATPLAGNVTWTLRNGGGGTASLAALPTGIQAVLDAAHQLEVAASGYQPKHLAEG